jgi:predicted nucleic acid-binding protein
MTADGSVARRPTAFLVDTDICIDYLNGVKRMREIVDSPGRRVYYATVTRKELLAKPGSLRQAPDSPAAPTPSPDLC